MMRQGALCFIHSGEQLPEYTAALFDLSAKADPTRDAWQSSVIHGNMGRP
jgi:hypothetical protein